MHYLRKWRFLWGLAALTLFAAGVLSYFAYRKPDALEYSLEKSKTPASAGARQSPAQADNDAHRGLMPGYSAPQVGHRFLSGAIAGVAGVVITFAILTGIGAALKSRRKKEAKTNG